MQAVPSDKVMVITSNADVWDPLRDWLRPRFDVTREVDRDHARRTASAHLPDVIVADMAPATSDAIALLAGLRANSSTATIPVIFLCAEADVETCIEAIEAGAVDCLKKPINEHELLIRARRAVVQARRDREALRREERLRADTAGILGSMKEAFMLVDADWRILYVNAAGERMSGGVSRASLLGRSHWDAYPATLGTIVEWKYRQAMTSRRAVKFEHYYAPYGRWFENGASPVGDGTLLLYAYDITDRKHMEEALRASDARLNAELEAMNRLHDLSTRLLALSDLKTVLDEVLDASIAMLDAAMGCIELYHPQTGTLEIVTQRGFRQDFLVHFRASRAGDGSASARVIKTGQRVIIEDVEADADYAPHCRIAGSAGYRAVQSTPFVSRSGQLLGVLSTHFHHPHRPSERDLRLLDLYANQATDLIERIRAEQALRESENRATLILNSMTDGFAVLDSNGRFADFNPAARRMLAEQGINANDLSGRQYLTEVFREASDDESGRGYRRAMAERIPVAVENFFVPLNGWYSIRFFPIDAGGMSMVIEDITERKRAEQALRESEAKFRALADASPALIAQLSADGNAIYLNQRHRELFGDNAPELLGKGWHSVVHPDDAAACKAALEHALRDRARFHRRVRVKSWQGEWRWLDAYAAPWFMADGQYGGYVSIALDITEAVQLELTQRTYRMATEGGNEGFYIMRPIRNRHGAIVDFAFIDSNQRGAEFLGRRPQDLLGTTISALFGDAVLRRPMEILSNAMENGFYEDDVEVPGDTLLRVRWIHCKIVRSNGDLAVTVRDISDAKAHVHELERRSNEDALTGLPNRYWLQTYLPQAIARAAENHAELAVLFMDLDGFKAVNDTLGHSAGDELLRIAARRLKVAVRPQDKVARFGGDEFVIILEHITGKRDAAHVAERVLQAFQENFTLSRGMQSVGVSIGVSLFPFDGTEADTLLRNADNAMYSVKTSGKRGCRFYGREFTGVLRGRVELEAELRHALACNQFIVHYQPRIDMATGAPCSMEALVRWMHPTKGLLGPLEFVPVAEETGLIHRLGEMVIDKVSSQLGHWVQAGHESVPVSINVSPRQFDEADIANILSASLAIHHIDPKFIEIELTESSMISESSKVSDVVTAIHEMGSKLLVDDFGTGYSSLSRLQQLDFDVLKVDRAFTCQLGRTEKAGVFFKAIITMAHALGMRVVAEGVESAQQTKILMSLCCDEIQGYYLSRPLPPEQVQAFLQKWSFPSID
jgi:diguanylate cyclase (GGDEF)-like protein/PAS domain S-box-containing protein